MTARSGRVALAAAVWCLAAGAEGAGAAVNVYSSLPRQGTSAAQTRAVEQGIRLALQDRGGRAGGQAVNYIPLDDSTRANPGTADEAQTRRNAQRVAADPFAIAYVGEFNSGGTKVSLPILNRAGLLQVSPSNTYNGLTVDAPGTMPGEPHVYYPTGRRTYARLVPNDVVQGAALATMARRARCGRVDFVWDGSPYGAGIVANARRAGRRIGLRLGVVVQMGFRRLRALAARVGAGCVVYGGVTWNGAIPHFRALAAGHPGRRFFGSDGVAEQAFADPRRGGVSHAIGRRTLLTVATLGVRDFPAAGQAMFRRLRATFGLRAVDPFSAYGYEAMRIVLDALDRAAPRAADRAAVVDAFLAAGPRDGVLGRYSIDANGDTTSRRYGVYGISRGWIAYRYAIVARGTS